MILTVLLLLGVVVSRAQAPTDPTLTAMILLYTEKAKKQLKSQEKVMLLQTTGHIWTKEEVEATTKLQREFNNYLDSFRSIVCYAAQIYGFYHEITRLTDNRATSPSNLMNTRPMRWPLRSRRAAIRYTAS